MSTADTDRIRRYFAGARWKATPGRRYLLSERHLLLRQAAASLGAPLVQLALCDAGCGDGHDLEMWRVAGMPEPHLAGTELVVQRADEARRRLPQADIREVEDERLPFASAAFDICTASLVLSTLRPVAARQRLLGEMTRCTKPGGLVMVYDFAVRKPWNRQVTAISTRGLAALWRPPDETKHAAPLLPLLEVLLRLPSSANQPLVGLLPRTHRLWIWKVRADEK